MDTSAGAPYSRSSGVLLHPTSLAGRFGIGDLGPRALEFVDFLASAGQRLWQVLPLGPTGKGAFPFRATVQCIYLDKALDGRSPKFACRIGDTDEVKVKYGGDNGEVYGEVLATRLLWALGFGADAIYPVNVVCRGCPDRLGGTKLANGDSRFDLAVGR